MLIIKTVGEMRAFSREQRQLGKTVALVPTMGCLHEGHLTLIEAARLKAEIIVVSIYVNPTQFSVTEDFGKYPRQRADDRKILQELQVSATFEPDTLYRKQSSAGEAASLAGSGGHRHGDHETFVQVEHLQKGLCGKSRPHFFRGVATVVLKLFHIVEPDHAFFGQKDYQQLQILKRMAQDLDMAVEVHSVPIKREPDGLAMSSRNKLLSPEARSAALSVPASLQWAEQAVTSGSVRTSSALLNGISDRLQHAGGKVDYIEVVDAHELQPVVQIHARSLVIAVAAIFGGVRLIDNVLLSGIDVDA